jgi:hypothetical protein
MGRVMEHEVGKVCIRVFIADWNHYATYLPALNLWADNPKTANSTRRTHGCGLQPLARWAKLLPRHKRRTSHRLAARSGRSPLKLCSFLVPMVHDASHVCQVGIIPHIFERRAPAWRPTRLSMRAFCIGSLGRICTFVVPSKRTGSHYKSIPRYADQAVAL